MTLILPGADIRGYYAALGITLPRWSTANAPCRCFADPAAHTNGDRHPSASVNLETGAWRCHGCGAAGGAYDAAVHHGHGPRSAIELMIRHRLIERRAQLHTARELIAGVPHPPRRPRPARRPQLRCTEVDVERWQQSLLGRPNLGLQLARNRGWAAGTMRELELGWDRGRITIPIRDAQRRLQGVLRYHPRATNRPKMLAVPGTRLGLIPHPAAEPARDVMLVEGPPDMITARSHGLPAIAVPGDHAWDKSWAQLLAGRSVTIIMDADDAGRAAARRIEQDLQMVAHVVVYDVAPDRSDGYDLSDRLLADPGFAAVTAT